MKITQVEKNLQKNLQEQNKNIEQIHQKSLISLEKNLKDLYSTKLDKLANNMQEELIQISSLKLKTMIIISILSIAVGMMIMLLIPQTQWIVPKEMQYTIDNQKYIKVMETELRTSETTPNHRYILIKE